MPGGGSECCVERAGCAWDLRSGAARAARGTNRVTGDLFCLESTNRFSNAVWSPLSAPYDRCQYQGISPGWGDMYQAGLSGQWVVADGAPAGPATLSALANPAVLLCEGTLQYASDGVTLRAHAVHAP